MKLIYKRIFNLLLGHDYFADGFNRYVNLVPTAETQKLLQNGRMLFKNLPYGITILYRALDDEISPLIELDKNQRFSFVLNSTDISNLLNVSNLDESPAKQFESGNILYYSNDPANPSMNGNNPEILSLEILDSLRSRLFTFTTELTGNPASVKLIVTNPSGDPVSVGQDENGDPLPEKLTLNLNANNFYEQQIDLTNYEKGKYTFTILNTSETTTLKEEKIYADEDLEKKQILGIADIIYESSSDHLYGETEEYKLLLNRANTNWKYFIVNKSQNLDLITDSLQIVDSGSVNGLPYTVNNFSRAYASIELTAKSTGSAGNSILLGYSGTGSFPAISTSGNSLSGGATGISAKGQLTVINNTESGYTISIGGIDFTEGADFLKDLSSPSETAANLISAINSNGSSVVTASSMRFDFLINDSETIVFRSDKSIPFFENPKLNIELQQVSSSQKIIANLPNPPPGGTTKVFAEGVETEVYVFI